MDRHPQNAKVRGAESALRLFACGLLLNLAFLGAALSFKASRQNLQPVPTVAPTVWQWSDSGTYVRSAQAFLETGVFAGADGSPDVHRTVGYPAFLAVAMVLGGRFWVPVVWLLQALAFAFIYPALACVAREWFHATDRQARRLLLAYAALGAGCVYTPVPLTDQIFTVCLWGSLALGTLAVRRGGGWRWLGHLATLGAAASIRPTLALFPCGFAALSLALRPASVVVRSAPSFRRRVVGVFLVQMFLCQAPAIRNYVHHGVWVPSDVMVNNLSDYLAKDVLSFTGRPEVHASAESDWKDLPPPARLRAQTTFALDVFSEHPFATVGIAGMNFALNTLETHWIQALNLFRATLHCDLKRWAVLPPELKAFHLFWALLHAGLALAACRGVWCLARQRQWAFLVFALVFSLPYLYSATDAQGARFRLYLEGLILMLAAIPSGLRVGRCHGN